MTMERIRERLHAVPFEPFTIHLADGRAIPVSHPDYILAPPEGRIISVYHDRMIDIIDVLMITTLEMSDKAEQKEED